MNCNRGYSKLGSTMRVPCMILITVSAAGVHAPEPRDIKGIGTGSIGNATTTTGSCLFVYFNHIMIVI